MDKRLCYLCNASEGMLHLPECVNNPAPARGAEAVDNAIGGHDPDRVYIDEAALIYPGDLPAATGSGAEIKIDSPLPDVMVGVEVPPAGTEGLYSGYPRPPAPEADCPVCENTRRIQDAPDSEEYHPCDTCRPEECDVHMSKKYGDAFEVWIYRKIGEGYGGAVQARGSSAEDAFLFAFTEMQDGPIPQALPPRDSEEYYQRIYQVLSRAFTELLEDGYDAIEINASACGMARRSMEQLVGKDKAIAWDNFVRKQIGWDKAKARIIYPNQVVKGRRGKS